MFLSPFKRTKKQKRKILTINMPPPPKIELCDQFVATLSSKVKDPKKLPLTIWMNNFKNLEANWMRNILGQESDPKLELSSLCLVYCFFIGRKNDIFESSIGKSGKETKFMVLYINFLEHRFQDHYDNCSRVLDNDMRQRFSIDDAIVANIVSSIEECAHYKWDKKSNSPIVRFLFEQNRKAEAGWLFVLLCQNDRWDSPKKPDRHAKYLITIIFCIMKGFCENFEALAIALGKSGSKKANQKRIRLHANETVIELLGDMSRNASSTPRTVATAPTAPLTETTPGSVQEPLSPKNLPASVSLITGKENTSPMTVDVMSPGVSDVVGVFGSPKAARRNSTPLQDVSMMSIPTPTPQKLSEDSPLAMSTGNSQVQLRKKAFLGPTPRRTLFPLLGVKASQQTNCFSPDCKLFMDALGAVENDEDLERQVLQFVLRRADHNGMFLNTKIFHCPQRPVNATTTARCRQIFAQRMTHSVMEFVRDTVPGAKEDPDLQRMILAKAIEWNFDCIVYDKVNAEEKVSALEVLEIRNRAGWNVSTSVVTSIIRDVTCLLKKKNMVLSNQQTFEGQLRKKIGRLESTGAVPPTFEHVECYVTKDDVEKCLYYYIENVPLLMERLVAGCILEGEMEDSMAFSTFENKIIFRFGADRGGGDLIMMIALANRRKGNHGRFSIPIGVVEKATEIYSNLKKTIYSDTRKAILEQLVNQQLFMVRMKFFEEENTSAAPQDVKCFLLSFVGVDMQDLSTATFKCTLDAVETIDNFPSEGLGWKSFARERVTVCDARINKNMFIDSNGKPLLDLKLKLLQYEDNYVGCRVIATRCMEEIFSFKFDTGVSVDGIDLQHTMADCLQLIGVPCEDGKMCATAYGLSTCGSSFPCPKCLWALNQTLVPSWAENCVTTGTIEWHRNYPQRVGKHSRKACYSNFTKLIGRLTGEVSLQVKKSVYSVVNEPLLHIDDDLLYLHTGDPMHVSQGLMTHLTEETAVQLQKVTNTEPEFVEAQTAKIEDFVQEMSALENSRAFKSRQSRMKVEDKFVKDAHKKMMRSEESERYCQEYTNAAAKRDEVSRRLGYEDMVLKIHGAEELKSLLNTFRRSKKKNFTKTVYLFMKAIKTFAGDFNKNHGQYELTNARGIKALGKTQEIYDMVVNGCNHPDVVDIMDWWRDSAKRLLEISIVLKSQDKISADGLRKLKEDVANYVRGWTLRLRTYEKKNPIFWKMHMLLCALIPFIETTGMSGRCSTEGFENKHHVMNQIRKLMAPIAQDKVRCKKLSQRQQSCLVPGIEEVHCFFEEEDCKRKTGPRGHYVSFGTRTKLLENLPLSETIEETAIEGFFVSEKKNYIPEELREIYYYMLLGKVPDSWSRTFFESELLGSKASNAAQYIPP